MKILLKLIISIIFITFTFNSCKKNETGGKATLKGTIKHHNKTIPGAYVYIKFNATEFPGEDYYLYDTYVKADENGNYTINFYKGSYYIYAIGNDLDIPFPYIVKGGLSVSLRNKENLIKDIAVTEN